MRWRRRACLESLAGLTRLAQLSAGIRKLFLTSRQLFGTGFADTVSSMCWHDMHADHRSSSQTSFTWHELITVTECVSLGLGRWTWCGAKVIWENVRGTTLTCGIPDARVGDVWLVVWSGLRCAVVALAVCGDRGSGRNAATTTPAAANNACR
jgi:hypothetical protein